MGISSHPSLAIRHGTRSRYTASTAGLKTSSAHQTPRAAEPAKMMRYCRLEARSFFRAMAAECDLPQWHIESNNGRRDLPRGVMAYTTRGGVSAYTVRSTIPVLCRSRSCLESVRCVIPAIERFSSENRLVPWKSCWRTAAFQRPPTMCAVVSTGQSSGRLIMLGASSILYTMYRLRVTYPHVTVLDHSSSILTTTISGLTFQRQSSKP